MNEPNEEAPMAQEKRCDATHALIIGIDAGEGPMTVESGGYVLRVEVIGWPDELGPERPNLRWEAVRRLIEGHTDDPRLEGGDDAGVVKLPRKKAAS